jgi:SAM-dependent methyltransferase
VKDYLPHSYGEAFADVYDDWYERLGDLQATVATLRELAAGGPVLELGVGTGRIAIPLAAAGVEVVGLDASEAMLARLRAKPGGTAVRAVLGTMPDELPDGPFPLVFIAYNTFFNLLSADSQRACFLAVADRLAPRGRFLLEAFVPEEPAREGSVVELRSMGADHVVLSVSRHDGADQRAEGQFVELTELHGVRLRPWAVRYSTPAQLDAMAAGAGLRLERRTASWSGEPFTEHSDRHVSVYSSSATGDD